MRERERDRKADNMSRLVYISVSFVTAEQPTKSHKRRKWKKMEKQTEVNIIKRRRTEQSCTVDTIIDF